MLQITSVDLWGWQVFRNWGFRRNKDIYGVYSGKL